MACLSNHSNSYQKQPSSPGTALQVLGDGCELFEAASRSAATAADMMLEAKGGTRLDSSLGLKMSRFPLRRSRIQSKVDATRRHGKLEALTMRALTSFHGYAGYYSLSWSLAYVLNFSLTRRWP
jgi:hypothetical protein